MSKRTDLLWATFAAILPLCAAMLYGDPLFLGAWYYLAVFGATLLLSIILKPVPLFTFGATIALLATFAGYWIVVTSNPHPDGLIGLGHLFSLPGAALGLLGGIWLAGHKRASPVAALCIGFGAVLSGFFVNQLVLCNTLVWCGPLSLASQ